MPHSKIYNIIDIGSTKITTLVGQYFEAEDRFNIVAASSTPASGFRKGQIINLDQATVTLTQSIESAERMAGFQINQAYISFSAPQIQSQNSQGVVAISNSNGEISNYDIERVIDAAKAISLPSGMEIIQVIPRKYTVDGQDGVVNPIGMNGVRLEAETNLIIAPNTTTKNIYKCLEEAGIKVQSLIYSGLAAARSSLTETEIELGVALIDIGGNITTITIFYESAPYYCSVVPVGGVNVTNDLAIGLRLPLDEAEKIKQKLTKIFDDKKFEDDVDISRFGIDDNSKRKISVSTALNGIIRPRLEELASLINSELETNRLRQYIPAGIVITGGGSQTTNIKEIFTQIINLPVRLATLPTVGGLSDDILNPAYSSAIGLLRYSLEGNPIDQNTSSQRVKAPFTGILGRIKNLIEPLLP